MKRRNGEEDYSSSATGEYQVRLVDANKRNSSSAKYLLILHYKEGKELIGGCNPDEGNEKLIFLENGQIINSLSSCGGGDLIYNAIIIDYFPED